MRASRLSGEMNCIPDWPSIRSESDLRIPPIMHTCSEGLAAVRALPPHSVLKGSRKIKWTVQKKKQQQIKKGPTAGLQIF